MRKVRAAPTKRRTDRDGGHLLQRQNWYFDRRISFDTIFGVVLLALTLGGPIVFWGRTIESALSQTDKRVSLIETAQEIRQKFDVERDNINRERQKETSAKVDKLGEQMTVLQLSVGQLLAKPR